MFRRCGTGPKNAQLRRLRTESDGEWLFVTEPAQGVDVSIADLLLRSKQVMSVTPPLRSWRPNPLFCWV